MSSFLHSATAKAELTAEIRAEQAVLKKQAQSPIQTKKGIKGFWAQHPKTRDLFGAIMTMWRKSSARRPERNGFWAAYPYRDWSAHTGLPDRTLKRHLTRLEDHGLIERTLGRYGGSRVLTFIRPTRLALDLSTIRAGDWQHLGVDPNVPAQADTPKPATTSPSKPNALPEPKMTPEELHEILFGDHE